MIALSKLSQFNGSRFVIRAVLVVCALTNFSFAQFASAQEVKIWEFTPYEVEVWYALDPSLDLSDSTRSQFTTALQDELYRMYRAAWSTEFREVDNDLRGRFARDLSELKLDDLLSQDLTIVFPKDNPATNSLRTFDGALEKLSEIAITQEDKSIIEAAVANMGENVPAQFRTLAQKVKAVSGGLNEISEGLKAKSISAALVPRYQLKLMAEYSRTALTLLPWQTDSLIRQRDKIFFLYIGKDETGMFVTARELDCPMQYLGPTMRFPIPEWPLAQRMIAFALRNAFAPVARVEDAESKSAILRLRAGGLIVGQENPAWVHPGDLMQPIVRRDDKNGQPTLLEPLSWTYAAITETDGINMKANVYTYSGGPGLEGKKNRRTQRVLLRVRPLFKDSEIEIVVRGSKQPQGGCVVYQRDLITEEYKMLGRTDWRGRFTLTVPDEFGKFLPEEVRAAKAAAEKSLKDKKSAEQEAAEAKAKAEESAREGQTPPADSAPAVAAVEVKVVEMPDYQAAALPLRAPLAQLYIKSGETLLARLPVVPGLRKIEFAELADDSRRLEAEGFIRGFQGEILDLIGLRSLYTAKIKRLLKENKVAEAEKQLVELRKLRDYSAMAAELERLQRKLLDESVPLASKGRIDNMLQSTRDMLQKFLQNEMVRDAEAAVSQAQGGNATAPSATSSTSQPPPSPAS